MTRTHRFAPVLVVVSLLVVALAVSSSAGPVSARGSEPASGASGISKGTLDALSQDRPLWVPGELVVRFRPRIAKSDVNRVVTAHGATVKNRIPSLDVAVVDLAPGDSVLSAVEDFEDDPAVAFAEPNSLSYPAGAVPNDPRWDDLWGLHNTGQSHPISDPPPATMSGTAGADADVLEAWDKETGLGGTVIAVLDSGVAVGHPDLDANLWTNPTEVDNGVDDDGNGLVDDVHGWDFAQDDETLLDGSSFVGFDHGTHVAGIIAAEKDNSTGVVGVCPECSIMVVKIMRPMDTDRDGEPDSMLAPLDAHLEGLAYARREGADIVNASIGGGLWKKLEYNGYRNLGKAGILATISAGNAALDNDMYLSYEFGGSLEVSPEYPASYDIPQILSVAASNHKDQYGYHSGCATEFPRWVCHMTNWGHDSVDLAAPGIDIVSTVPGGYETFNGTSMSAPFAAGVAGLVESEHPEFGAMQLKNAVMNSVDRPATLREMHAFESGPAQGRFTRTSGRVNADRALNASTANATPLTDGNVKGARGIRRTKQGRVAWPADTNDVFKKRLRKGRQYKVVLDGPSNHDLDLLVWAPGTKEIWQLELGCYDPARGPCKLLKHRRSNDGNEQTRFIAKRGGVYYIHVEAYFDRGDYTLRIRQV